MPRIQLITRILSAVPGRRTFGIYRFMPFYFLLGAALEWSMINWRPNGHNFYDTYKRKNIEKEALRQIELEDLRDKVLGQKKH